MPRIDYLLRAVAVLAVAALTTLGGCLGDDCDCPALAPLRVATGTLRPSDAGLSAAESMVVDRDAGVVTLTSTRDGHVVVERWRIANTAVRY